jgi:DNA polymerase-3 subunit delta
MQSNLRQAIQELRQGKRASLYVLYGEEQWLMEEFVRHAKEILVPSSVQDLNVATLDLSESPLDELLDQAETSPFLADCRLLVAKNALFFSANARGKAEHDLDRLQAYLNQPAPQTVLIFLVPAAKLDERKKLVKQVKRQAVVIPCKPLTKEALIRWVERRARERGVSLSAEMIEVLLSRVGQQLALLDSELEKLSLYALNHPLSREDLERLVPRTLEEDVFLMVDALLEGRSEYLFRIFYDLMQKKEEPLKLLGLFSYQMRLLIQVQHYHFLGYSSAQIADVIGAHPYAIQRAQKHLRTKKPGEFAQVLADLLQELARLDRAMKSGRTQAERIADLEHFLLIACQKIKKQGAVPSG